MAAIKSIDRDKLYDVIVVNGAYFVALWMRFDCEYSAINPEYLQALDAIEHGGGAYRSRAGQYRGFTMNGSPFSWCACMFMWLFCCRGGIFCC